MAVPKQRKTKSRQGNRRMHIYIKKTGLVNCKKCGKKVLPHAVCIHCGYYKGREVINVLEKLTKKERKKREKEMQAKESREKQGKPLDMKELSKR